MVRTRVQIRQQVQHFVSIQGIQQTIRHCRDRSEVFGFDAAEFDRRGLAGTVQVNCDCQPVVVAGHDSTGNRATVIHRQHSYTVLI